MQHPEEIMRRNLEAARLAEIRAIEEGDDRKADRIREGIKDQELLMTERYGK